MKITFTPDILEDLINKKRLVEEQRIKNASRLHIVYEGSKKELIKFHRQYMKMKKGIQ